MLGRFLSLLLYLSAAEEPKNRHELIIRTYLFIMSFHRLLLLPTSQSVSPSLMM